MDTTQNSFFIFCNDNVITQHNLKFTNMIISSGFSSASFSKENLAEYLSGDLTFSFYSEENNVAISPFTASLNENENDALWEEKLEKTRLDNYKSCPSRFLSIMAFADLNSCLSVSRQYSWDIQEVKHFILEQNKLNKISRHNMQIISLLRGFDYNEAQEKAPELIDMLANHYWSGATKPSNELKKHLPDHPLLGAEPIWEWLIEGKLTLVENDHLEQLQQNL